ncbi:uncharacterized protein LOC127866676 [Dreissena polymorpha]|uniref:B box-type domain-containing protein n=1 Tax=Dreissena polymorpha TaxID=45954 RepID=A0A9D4RES5_DREPO|nr:uncharacterized protein LOC127866676 [Dreissena polymorpha]KAH3863912.1 hypothetical protein DPMN_026918 [Dreissena polymorpha]
MASNPVGDSDSVYDFNCTTCEENDLNTNALFYCDKCSKFYCHFCVGLHNQLMKKHTVLGRENMKIWPVSKTTVQPVAQCKQHKNETITSFCEDHDSLLCHVCHVYYHKQCGNVVLLIDKVKALKTKEDFHFLSRNITTLQEKLIEKTHGLDLALMSLHITCKNNLEEIRAFRKAINCDLDELEKRSIEKLVALESDMRSLIHADKESCEKLTNTMESLKRDMQEINNETGSLYFVIYKNCLEQFRDAELSFDNITPRDEVTVSFNPNEAIKRTMSSMSALGKIAIEVSMSQDVNNHPQKQQSENIGNKLSVLSENEIKVKDKAFQRHDNSSDTIEVLKMTTKLTQHPVRMNGDSKTCSISGISETSGGQLLIADKGNKKLKLLDRTFRVVAEYIFPADPVAMCSIHSGQVAVAVEDFGHHNLHEVHFITVNGSDLVKHRMLKFEHKCFGVAHSKGDLYIASFTELFHYNTNGRLVKKIYDDKTTTWTVAACAVSPDGDRLYVANSACNKLLTLNKDGIVLAELKHKALEWICSIPGLYVTGAGHVLVCGGWSNIILQVDEDGTEILTELITGRNAATRPMSVCFRNSSSTLVVGMKEDNNILVCRSN